MNESGNAIRTLLLGLGLVLLIATSSSAQLAWVGIGEGVPGKCIQIQDVPGQVAFVYVMVMESVPMQEIFVATTPPACNTMTLLSEAPTSGIFVPPGDIRTGLNFDLGGCFSGPMMLYEFIYFTNGTTNCCDWMVDPTVSFVDCNGDTQTNVARSLATLSVNHVGCGSLCEGTLLLEPHSPTPADGEAAAPVDSDLSWINQTPSGGLYIVSMGTSPGALSPVYSGPIVDTFDPGILSAGQAYYWQVEIQDVLWFAASEEWSFTTGSTLPVHEASWGRIKALYN